MKEFTAGATHLRRALSYLRPHSKRVCAILGLTLLSAIVQAIEPLVMKSIVDQLSLGMAPPAWVGAVGCLALLVVLREALAAVGNWLSWKTRLGIHFELLEATVDRLQHLSLHFHRDQAVGATMMRLDRGIQGFLNAVTEVAFHVVPSIVYLVIAATIMFELDYRLALLVLGFAPLPALIAARAGAEQAERERSLLDVWAKIYSRFNEVLSGIVTVRSFAMEDAEKRRFLDGVSSANQRVIAGVARDARTGGLSALSVGAARVCAIALGGWLIAAGHGTVGTLVAFLAYLNGLFGPMQGLTSVYATLQRASVAVNHIYSILDTGDRLLDAPDARRLESAKGAVQFEHVSFSYESEQTPVLDGFDLSVQPGERVAFVGPSGSGKSTLMALMQRMYDPTRGAIRLDGWDLRQLEQKWLRQQIGVVLQDAVLFDDTILANIAYGRPSASRAQIVEAAKAAHAHHFISRLPRGYETRVGERGKLLSGGERQRIAIARALLKDPPLLILDEATSALDSESEQLVQQALEQLVSGRTTFVIAHRLSTVVNADRIVVLKDGHIHEMGKHQELLAASGYYAFLVKQQIIGLGAPPQAA